MKVGDYMTQQPTSVPEETSMSEAVMLLRKHQIRHLPVVDGTTLVGIVSDRDIRRASPSLLSGVDMSKYEEVLSETPVSKIMTRDPFTVSPDLELIEAVRALANKKIGGLPVVNGSKELVGIFTDVDALRVLVEVLSEVPQR
jgi:acetoin utilization protein AcuB